MKILKVFEWAGLVMVVLGFIIKLSIRQGHLLQYERENEYLFLIGMALWSLAYLMRGRTIKNKKEV